MIGRMSLLKETSRSDAFSVASAAAVSGCGVSGVTAHPPAERHTAPLKITKNKAIRNFIVTISGGVRVIANSSLVKPQQLA
jgi:hypothetical protein